MVLSVSVLPARRKSSPTLLCWQTACRKSFNRCAKTWKPEQAMMRLPLSNFGQYFRSDAREMEQAQCYGQWRDAAIKRDHLLGLDAWKRADSSRLYDYRSIRNRL